MRGMQWGRKLSLTVVVVGTLGVALAGCGGSSSTSSSTNTAHSTAASTLNTAQTVAATDAICTTTIKLIKPYEAKIAAIEKSGASKQKRESKEADSIEQIAAETRAASRLMGFLHPAPAIRNQLIIFASTLLELAVIEEQLSEAYREQEPLRVPVVEKNVLGIRKRAHIQGQALGLQVCAKSAANPFA